MMALRSADAEVRRSRWNKAQQFAEAAALLKKVAPDASKYLARLRSLKTKAGYTHRPATLSDVRTANRSLKALLAAAELV